MKRILQQVAEGKLAVDKALKEIGELSYQPVRDFAKLDHHRELRSGFPEVVFAQGKELDHLSKIFHDMHRVSGRVMATRVDSAAADFLCKTYNNDMDVKYYESARILFAGEKPIRNDFPKVAVACAGTADYFVAEEAAVTLELHGCIVDRIYDIGVAGLPRLLRNLDRLKASSVIIAAAGMEGALPSVLSGLVKCPLIAVPTSVGYGASFNGLAALLAMLNTCSPGVAVVNIDNGFGAAAMCLKILTSFADMQASQTKEDNNTHD